jgi:hypothetical protein
VGAGGCGASALLLCEKQKFRFHGGKEQCAVLPLHYLFDPIPVGANA